MNKELKSYIDRYQAQRNELQLAELSKERLLELFIKNCSGLNNFFMAGMGACTLIIRLGAVFQLVKRLKESDIEEDALLTKQIIDNLRENLPSDTNWKIIWEVCVEVDDVAWSKPILKAKGEQQNLLEKFITFRNKFVHGDIGLSEQYIKEIHKGLLAVNEICEEQCCLFEDFVLSTKNDKYYLTYNSKSYCLHPFIQKGANDSPYIFQGLYHNKQVPELIGVNFGDTVKQNTNQAYEEVFEPMTKSLISATVQVFDHSKRINYYKECFVGRDKESDALINWAKASDELNVLPVFSDAGMGKGALMANVIDTLRSKENQIPVLYHFCGSGIQNSLHAILYHLIIQGQKYPPNGASLWKVEDEQIARKLKRLPSRYQDVIHLFQDLLDNCFNPPKSLSNGNLVILIDGLDEAAVAYASLHISDWFYKYDDKGEIESDWESTSNIRWVFTYRKGFYRFSDRFKQTQIDALQPLQGLSEEAARNALEQFSPSPEFLDEVIKRGAIV
jgi:hypothetical protein